MRDWSFVAEPANHAQAFNDKVHADHDLEKQVDVAE